MPPDASDSFQSALTAITGTGRFHSSDTASFFLPQLHIQGLGEVAFPLPPSQAAQIVALAEAAPYGMGTRTVFDETVRKCWQLDASVFEFGAPQWNQFLARTLAKIREDLGIGGEISAHPYKLLVYGPGGHFKAHKDTEKLDSMFGTLVVALPSRHEGGRLFIRHDGREVVVDFSLPEHFRDFQFAAFFADCEHEVEPVRSGHRCCVVYNLRLETGDPGSLNLSLNDQARSLLSPLAALKDERRGDLAAVLLEHNYTQANLSLRGLKGNDQARAQALFAAASQTGLVAHLALVTFHQSGQLEDFDFTCRRRSSRFDDDPELTGTMGEVYEECLSIGHWRDARDHMIELGEYHVDRETLLGDENFGKGNPDEQQAEGYTGNAGCTMDYWYRRAAIVLWDARDEESILCRHDFKAACALLGELARGPDTGPGSRFRRIADAALERYPDALPSYWNESTTERHLALDPLHQIFAALAAAKARDLLQKLLARLPAEAFRVCDTPLWRNLIRTFGPETFEPVCHAILKEGASLHRQTLFRILDALADRATPFPAARAIAAALARLKPSQTTDHRWRNPPHAATPGNPAETRILLQVSHWLDQAPDIQAARTFLAADSSLPCLRTVLGPALLNPALAPCMTQPGSLAPEFLALARQILKQETLRTIEPYPDWKRPCPKPHQPADHPSWPYQRAVSKYGDPLEELSSFMAAPLARTHQFARPQHERCQLEDFIARHRLDLDCTTIRKGSPHKLVCTKTDNSYHDALKVRAKDQELLTKLNQLATRASG